MANYRSTIGYDAKLNPTQITRPDFETWQFQVEPNTGEALTGPASDANLYPAPGTALRGGERVTLTDPNGHKTEYFRNDRDKQSWVVEPKHYRAYESLANSNFTQAKTTYDLRLSNRGWSRIADTTDVAGNTEKRTYYSNGLLRSIQRAQWRQRLLRIQRRPSAVHLSGQTHRCVKRYTYQYLSPHSSLITEQTGPSIAAGQRTQTQTTYDAHNNITAVTRHGYRLNADGEAQAISRRIALRYNDQHQIIHIDGAAARVTTASANTTLSRCARSQLSSAEKPTQRTRPYHPF